MRTHLLDKVIDSDVDLTKLSSRRVSITMVKPGEFRITSTLRFLLCERNEFIGRYLRRMKPGLTYIKGNCSAPYGYFWGPLTR